MAGQEAYNVIITQFTGARGELDKWVWAQLPSNTICDGRLRIMVCSFAWSTYMQQEDKKMVLEDARRTSPCRFECR